jgi:hypothetical protein
MRPETRSAARRLLSKRNRSRGGHRPHERASRGREGRRDSRPGGPSPTIRPVLRRIAADFPALRSPGPGEPTATHRRASSWRVGTATRNDSYVPHRFITLREAEPTVGEAAAKQRLDGRYIFVNVCPTLALIHGDRHAVVTSLTARRRTAVIHSMRQLISCGPVDGLRFHPEAAVRSLSRTQASGGALSMRALEVNRWNR